MPYHVTWAHELENGLGEADSHVVSIDAPAEIPAAVARMAERAAAGPA